MPGFFILLNRNGRPEPGSEILSIASGHQSHRLDTAGLCSSKKIPR
jgi:hypothetical protein